MDPEQHPHEDIQFQVLIYDYFRKRGFLTTAEIFRNESQLTRFIIPDVFSDFDTEPYGVLYNFWTSNQPKPETSSPSQSQDPNIGSVINTTPEIISEGYSFMQLASFPSRQKLSSCDISTDGRIVASGGISGKPFLCYTEIRDSFTTSDIESHSSAIYEVRFQPGTHIFATSSDDKTIKIWDADRPERALFDIKCIGKARSLDFHPLGVMLCSSDSHNIIDVWDINSRCHVTRFKLSDDEIEVRYIYQLFKDSVSSVRFQPFDGNLLAIANQNVITIIDFKTFRVQCRLKGHVKDITSITWDKLGLMIASVSEDRVCVWSLFSVGGACIHQYPLNRENFRSIIFHPKYQDVLVVGGYQGLKLLIIMNGSTCSGPSETSITGLAGASMRTEFIASVSTDSVVKIWK